MPPSAAFCGPCGVHQGNSPLITLALSKGRIFDDSLPLLRAAGIEVLEG